MTANIFETGSPVKQPVRRILIRGIQIFLISLLLTSCKEEPIIWDVESTHQVIAQYVTSNPEFSEFAQILETTDLYSLLSVRGPFTLFLPSDVVMQAYYDKIGVSSQEELETEFLEDLAKNHLVPSRMATSDFGLGALRDLNALGDYLVTEFEGSDIILNKYSMIIKRDIPAANGVIHHIDQVLEPVTLSLYEQIAGDPSFSLFTEGLERTMLKDTLNVISFPYGAQDARTRFTILAVADTTFNRYGINNIDDLIARYTDAPDSITYLENGFYRYMEYHCLGGTFYLNDLEDERLYPILSFDNNIYCEVSDDYKLNPLNDSVYTGFNIGQSNYPAKNGTMHTVNDLLPVYEPPPTTIVFETTDYFDMKQSDYYGKYYARFFDGQNTFEYIKWEGDYLIYYFKDHDTGKLMNHDCLSMSGWWWVEITSPKIMKGEYTMYSNLWGGQTDYAVYVDGVNTALINQADPAESTSWGEFNWTETERHTIKVVTKTPGLLFWDTMILEPPVNK